MGCVQGGMAVDHHVPSKLWSFPTLPQHQPLKFHIPASPKKSLISGLPYLPETVLLSKFVFRANIYTQCYGLSLSFKRIFKALSPIVLSNMPCHLRGKAEGVLFNPQALPNTQESILLGFHLLPFPLCHRKCLDFCKVSHIIFTTLPQISWTIRWK